MKATEDLFREHADLVRQALASRRFPPSVDRDDLAQEARIALWQAARTWDPARGVPFTAWARSKIGFAVVAHLRQLDILTRSHRARVNAGAAAPVALGSLDAPLGDGHTAADLVADPRARDPGALLEARDLADWLSLGLSGRDAVLFRLRFREGLPQHAAALAVGVSQSRAAQLEARLAEHVQGRLGRLGLAAPPAARVRPSAAALAGGKTWRGWGAADDAELARLRAEGLSAAACAARLGRTLPAVKNRIGLLGLGRTSSLVARWLPLLARPHSLREVARAEGVSVWAVKQAKRKLRRLGHRLPAATRGEGD